MVSSVDLRGDGRKRAFRGLSKVQVLPPPPNSTLPHTPPQSRAVGERLLGMWRICSLKGGRGVRAQQQVTLGEQPRQPSGFCASGSPALKPRPRETPACGSLWLGGGACAALGPAPEEGMPRPSDVGPAPSGRHRCGGGGRGRGGGACLPAPICIRAGWYL